MQSVGLDRVDLARRPEARQHRNASPSKSPPRVGTSSARQGSILIWLESRSRIRDVEQDSVKPGHRHAHRHHHHAADNPDQGGENHQAGFVGADECPQPLRCLEIAGSGHHFRGSVDGRRLARLI